MAKFCVLFFPKKKMLGQLIATIPIILEFLGVLDLYFRSNQQDVHNLLQICKTWRNYLIPYIIPKLQFCTMCKLCPNVLPFVRHLIDVTYLSTPDWFHKIAPQINTLSLTYPHAHLNSFVNLQSIQTSKSIHHTCFKHNTVIENHLSFSFPKTLKIIRIGSHNLQFSDSMFTNLPNQLEKLSFPRFFNSPISNLPASLISLTLGQEFNQSFILPPNLQILFFGNKFNQPIELVPSLKYLYFGSDFNQPINIPNGLKSLHVSKNYHHNILFPTTLTSLYFNSGFVSPNLQSLPKLKRLHLGSTYNHTWQFIDHQKSNILSRIILPQALKHMTIFNNHFNAPIGLLPNGLQSLKLSWTMFNRPLGNLPNSLQVLQLGNNFNHPLGNLPNSLQVLLLGNEFNHPLGNLPNSLEVLQLGNNFNHPLGNLPNLLKELTLGKDFQCQIVNIPPSLETFSVGSLFVSQMEDLLPSTNVKIYSKGKLITRRVITRSMSKRQKI